MKLNKISRVVVSFVSVVAVTSLWTGCGERKNAGTHDQAHAQEHGPATPPHGGTPVPIAPGQIYLEFVAVPPSGNLQAYVLDQHMTNYIPVQETKFEMIARWDATTHHLEFVRWPEAPAGTSSPKSALFKAKADWLNTVQAFDGTIPSITLNGKRFTNISFSFPGGRM